MSDLPKDDSKKDEAKPEVELFQSGQNLENQLSDESETKENKKTEEDKCPSQPAAQHKISKSKIIVSAGGAALGIVLSIYASKIWEASESRLASRSICDHARYDFDVNDERYLLFTNSFARKTLSTSDYVELRQKWLMTHRDLSKVMVINPQTTITDDESADILQKIHEVKFSLKRFDDATNIFDDLLKTFETRTMILKVQIDFSKVISTQDVAESICLKSDQICYNKDSEYQRFYKNLQILKRDLDTCSNTSRNFLDIVAEDFLKIF